MSGKLPVDPSLVIARHFSKHLDRLLKLQRRIELFAPQLNDAINETRRLATAFEKQGEGASDAR